MEKILVLISLALTVNAYKFFSNKLDNEPSLSILYTHDKNSDVVVKDCLTEMYPRKLYKYPLRIDRNDVPCIIHCVLKKFRIMTNDGVINVRNYYRRVSAIHRHDPRVLISDVGDTCAKNINNMNLDHDVCKKAKVFNDCTQLYAITLTDITLLLLLLASCASAKMSVMYTHDRLSDLVVESCLNEMYPKPKKVQFQESDEACIIFCVLRKFGIMTSSGAFNLDVYKKRVGTAHQLSQYNAVGDVGTRCIKLAKESSHSQDVCRSAKIFNDCTHLYRIML